MPACGSTKQQIGNSWTKGRYRELNNWKWIRQYTPLNIFFTKTCVVLHVYIVQIWQKYSKSLIDQGIHVIDRITAINILPPFNIWRIPVISYS